ncbi:hypothetical protein M407DRAFT_138887 [Tulasnella calospora MUT 4182]|uniref:ATP11-domain-containing protein n=1 Tax=Tulasnella calospora MUT 4182 TaxID=1051891 RepID=A0A0C3QSV8_9AGAM|nr:hypothetical protein M407DRAFT_138887 [Tulasnella calospora MUT 4182]
MLASVLRRRCLIKPQSRYNYTRWNSSLSGAYADKIKARLSQEGVGSIDELKTKLKKEGRAFEEPSLKPMNAPPASETTGATEASKAGPSAYKPKTSTQKRKDSSPVKPLSEFLNLAAIASKPHTVEQISALWNLFHASRSGGTGRGFLSAVVPVESYNNMLERAKKYPMFVLPLPRPTAQDSPAPSEDPDSSEQTPVEFHFIQWGMHPAPPVPSANPDDDLFTKPSPSSPSPNPPTSTILFTPLIQYKLHQSYAPPYLILTHYTDLAHSHGIVLLRGEITPTSSVTVGSDQAAASADGKFMISQTDAQLLALGVQRFYLPQLQPQSQGAEGGKDEAVELLRTFHESPADFRWETLLKFAHPAGFGGSSPTSPPSS